MFKQNMTYEKTITMVTEICCNCGVAFGMPSDLQEQFLKDSNKWFYCPNGHHQHYSKSTETKLKEQLAEEKQRAKTEQDRLYKMYLDELAEKSKLSRKLKRVQKGVCPCCTRSFTNLKRHMETQHPEIIKQAAK